MTCGRSGGERDPRKESSFTEFLPFATVTSEGLCIIAASTTFCPAAAALFHPVRAGVLAWKKTGIFAGIMINKREPGPAKDPSHDQYHSTL